MFAGDWFGSASKPTTVTTAPLRTKVDSESLLLVRFRSVVAELTDAVFDMTSDNGVSADTWIEIEALAEGERLARLQVTVPEA